MCDVILFENDRTKNFSHSLQIFNYVIFEAYITNHKTKYTFAYLNG